MVFTMQKALILRFRPDKLHQVFSATKAHLVIQQRLKPNGRVIPVCLWAPAVRQENNRQPP
jgi:hypothetical protein